MKIFSAAQIRACDAATIEAASITSLELMERAAVKCYDWLSGHFSPDTLFVVLCGMGNNGGDGLAIARLLYKYGYGVKAFVLHYTEKCSEDCHANLTRLRTNGEQLVSDIMPGTFITDIPQNIVIIDAILGTGLNRPVTGWLADFFGHINQLTNRKVAIDMPSGLFADETANESAAIIKADDTLSFQFYKRSFLHPESGSYTGKIHILDIGLDPTFIATTHTLFETTEAASVKHLYRPRQPFSHKGTYGNVLMIGGSYGMMGAITLATEAALKAGAGKVTALVPECGYTIMQLAIPEAMCRTAGKSELTEITGWEKYNAIGIGPGMGTDPDTVKAFGAFLDACKQPLVIDADALNILARNPDWLGRLPHGSVLTPHPKEFERLFGPAPDSMMQLEQARIQAMRYNVNIVLKGRYTAVVTSEGNCYYNTTGNPGMATGGSGDVLCGIITGLIAQGYATHDAAVMGVYLHGLAGDFAAEALSMEAMTAGDITRYLGKAFMLIS
ncbi:NAD(P)H-hydrate dehydratase [Chitinophagaceae bacterium MMS25-I14]